MFRPNVSFSLKAFLAFLAGAVLATFIVAVSLTNSNGSDPEMPKQAEQKAGPNPVYIGRPITCFGTGKGIMRVHEYAFWDCNDDGYYENVETLSKGRIRKVIVIVPDTKLAELLNGQENDGLKAPIYIGRDEQEAESYQRIARSIASQGANK